jgi:hypothetical protein
MSTSRSNPPLVGCVFSSLTAHIRRADSTAPALLDAPKAPGEAAYSFANTARGRRSRCCVARDAINGRARTGGGLTPAAALARFQSAVVSRHAEAACNYVSTPLWEAFLDGSAPTSRDNACPKVAAILLAEPGAFVGEVAHAQIVRTTSRGQQAQVFFRMTVRDIQASAVLWYVRMVHASGGWRVDDFCGAPGNPGISNPNPEDGTLGPHNFFGGPPCLRARLAEGGTP